MHRNSKKLLKHLARNAKKHDLEFKPRRSLISKVFFLGSWSSKKKSNYAFWELKSRKLIESNDDDEFRATIAGLDEVYKKKSKDKTKGDEKGDKDGQKPKDKTSILPFILLFITLLILAGWIFHNGSLGFAQIISRDNARIEKLNNRPSQSQFNVGDFVEVVGVEKLKMRVSPGYLDKPTNDILCEVYQGDANTIVSGPVSKDGLNWWQIRSSCGTPVGWVAEATPAGRLFIRKM